MHRWEDAHGDLIGIFPGNVLVHIKEVAIAFTDDVFSQPFDRVGKIEIHPQASRADTTAFVAYFLGRAGCDVAWSQVSVARVFALQVVIAVHFRNCTRCIQTILFALGDPDAAIVAQRLGHQCQLGLMFAADRNTGWMDLGIAGIREKSAFLVSAPSRADVATLGVG